MPSATRAAAIHTSLPMPQTTRAACSSAKFRGSSAAETPVGMGARQAGQTLGADVTGIGKPPPPRTSLMQAWQKLWPQAKMRGLRLSLSAEKSSKHTSQDSARIS